MQLPELRSLCRPHKIMAAGMEIAGEKSRALEVADISGEGAGRGKEHADGAVKKAEAQQRAAVAQVRVAG